MCSDQTQQGSMNPIEAQQAEQARRQQINQIGEDFKFQKRPSAADIFDDTFLPSRGSRLIN